MGIKGESVFHAKSAKENFLCALLLYFLHAWREDVISSLNSPGVSPWKALLFLSIVQLIDPILQSRHLVVLREF